MSSKTAHIIGDKWRSNDIILEENVDFSALMLSDRVLNGLENAGFKKPSPIQLQAIPLGRCGLDLVVQAKSGTGKTCVFTVIALENLLNVSTSQVLILTPTREIATQIRDVVKSIGSGFNSLKCCAFIGGLPLLDDQKNANDCQIAVGTPGRVRQLIGINALKIESIRLFILDEADKLLEESFLADINWIFSSLPENKQVIAASATFSKKLATLVSQYMRNPFFVRLNVDDIALLGICQYYCVSQFHPVLNINYKNKFDILWKILNTVKFSQCIIFCNMVTRVEAVCNDLNTGGFPTTFITSCQDQEDRLEAIEKLKTFQSRILVTSDLVARGIDAENVDFVINFDVPYDVETYLHRIGRAGRYGSKGISITMVTGNDLASIIQFSEKAKLKIYALPDPLPSNLSNLEPDVSQLLSQSNANQSCQFLFKKSPDKYDKIKSTAMISSQNVIETFIDSNLNSATAVCDNEDNLKKDLQPSNGFLSANGNIKNLHQCDKYPQSSGDDANMNRDEATLPCEMKDVDKNINIDCSENRMHDEYKVKFDKCDGAKLEECEEEKLKDSEIKNEAAQSKPKALSKLETVTLKSEVATSKIEMVTSKPETVNIVENLVSSKLQTVPSKIEPVSSPKIELVTSKPEAINIFHNNMTVMNVTNSYEQNEPKVVLTGEVAATELTTSVLKVNNNCLLVSCETINIDEDNMIMGNDTHSYEQNEPKVVLTGEVIGNDEINIQCSAAESITTVLNVNNNSSLVSCEMPSVTNITNITSPIILNKLKPFVEDFEYLLLNQYGQFDDVDLINIDEKKEFIVSFKEGSFDPQTLVKNIFSSSYHENLSYDDLLTNYENFKLDPIDHVDPLLTSHVAPFSNSDAVNEVIHNLSQKRHAYFSRLCKTFADPIVEESNENDCLEQGGPIICVDITNICSMEQNNDVCYETVQESLSKDLTITDEKNSGLFTEILFNNSKTNAISTSIRDLEKGSSQLPIDSYKSANISSLKNGSEAIESDSIDSETASTSDFKTFDSTSNQSKGESSSLLKNSSASGCFIGSASESSESSDDSEDIVLPHISYPRKANLRLAKDSGVTIDALEGDADRDTKQSSSTPNAKMDEPLENSVSSVSDDESPIVPCKKILSPVPSNKTTSESETNSEIETEEQNSTSKNGDNLKKSKFNSQESSKKGSQKKHRGIKKAGWTSKKINSKTALDPNYEDLHNYPFSNWVPVTPPKHQSENKSYKQRKSSECKKYTKKDSSYAESTSGQCTVPFPNFYDAQYNKNMLSYPNYYQSQYCCLPSKRANVAKNCIPQDCCRFSSCNLCSHHLMCSGRQSICYSNPMCKRYSACQHCTNYCNQCSVCSHKMRRSCCDAPVRRNSEFPLYYCCYLKNMMNFPH